MAFSASACCGTRSPYSRQRHWISRDSLSDLGAGVVMDGRDPRREVAAREAQARNADRVHTSAETAGRGAQCAHQLAAHSAGYLTPFRLPMLREPSRA